MTTQGSCKRPRVWPDENSQLQLEPRSSAPPDPSAGLLYFDDGTNTETGLPGLRVYQSLGWRTIPDIDQGSITPTITCGTSGTVTLTAGVNNLIYWTRIGRLVAYSGIITISSTSSPMGTMMIGTLPYRAISGGAAFQGQMLCPTGNIVLPAGTVAGIRVGAGTNTFRVVYITTTGAVSINNLDASTVSAGDILYLSGVYMTDQPTL